MRIVSVAQMRELERQTFALGTSEAELQNRAAAAVARYVATLGIPHPAVTAYVGPGNNGRDTFLASGLLLDQDWDAQVLLAPRHAVTDVEIDDFRRRGGRVVFYPMAPHSSDGGQVLLDGLLGIGGSGRPRPPLDEMVGWINSARHEDLNSVVVSVDVPSGLDADTGAGSEATVIADATVVLGGAKVGLLSASAARFTGRLHFAEIGVVEGPADAPWVLSADSIASLLPSRAPESHKGTFGRLLVIAGSERYVGAALLCSAAAVRGGVGIVSLAAPRWMRDVVASRVPEITYLLLPDGGPAAQPEACAAVVIDALSQVQAIALGPGLSQDGRVPDFVTRVLRARAELGVPGVVDADGLNALAETPGWTEWLGRDLVFTPHPGELRRLAPDQPSATERPWEAANALAQRWGVTLIAKGPYTAIGDGQEVWVNAAPNPALATGGTGDVLTGLTGAFLAQGLAVGQAARLAVWVHSQAGLRLADRFRAGGLAASDLVDLLPSVLADTLPRR